MVHSWVVMDVTVKGLVVMAGNRGVGWLSLMGLSGDWLSYLGMSGAGCLG